MFRSYGSYEQGVPVIVVNTGGPKVNTTVDSAIKIEPAPLQDMINETARAIKILAGDKEKREKMGRAARMHALDTFTLEARTEQMNKFYQEVLNLSK